MIWRTRTSSVGIAVLNGHAWAQHKEAALHVGRRRRTTTALEFLQQLALGDSKVGIIQNAFLTQLIQLT